MIDNILKEHVRLMTCRHEPCLYSGTFEGKEILFLRQVGDFAVACKCTDTANRLVDKISEKLSAPMKKLGIIDRYNGVDVTQTTGYFKIHSKTYLNKILENKECENDNAKHHINPIPMRENSAYLNILDSVSGPEDEDGKEKLETEMGFSYRKVLGEALFVMVTTRPDISFAIIKLSKYANNPAPEHYAALKTVIRYLRATIDEGLVYWRPKKNDLNQLLNPEVPRLFHQQSKQPNNSNEVLTGSVDSDWASDISTRK